MNEILVYVYLYNAIVVAGYSQLMNHQIIKIIIIISSFGCFMV